MDNWNTLEKYLVQIGADIDQNSFNSARSALNELKRHISGLKHAAAPLALAAAIGAIGKAAYDTIKSVAQADMEYKKLAASMWITKESAKALSVAMKTMGVTQEDLAWVPELREQFFRLRAEMQRFATPADADAQLRYIRDIGYDVQVLFVRLKMLKEWIAYYLIQYLEPYIEDFKAFINWLLEKVGTDLPGLARKVAGAMAAVLRPALATLKVLGSLVSNIYDFIEKLPEEVKAWATVFAVVGAAIMAGPFGGILMALSAAMILLEDFLGYMNGWESSETLAPLWEALLEFANGEGSGWMTQIKEFLSEVGRLLSNDVRQTIQLVRELKKSIPDIEEFGHVLLGAVKLPFQYMKMLGDLFVTILKAINLLLEGKKGEAWDALVEGIKNTDFTPAAAKEAAQRGQKMGQKFRHPGLTLGEKLGNGLREFFGLDTGGSGEGSDVVGNASQFERGYKWMDPTGANTDPRNQCASFASQMMAGAGVPVDVTMNGNDLASQFKEVGAYHRPGEYEPQPGDLVDWANHVGIYAGNGQYIARNSSGGVVRGDMAGMEKYFGALWGFGSVDELTAAKKQDTYEGVDSVPTMYAGVDSLPEKSYGSDVAAGFMSGSNEMAMDIPGLRGVFGGFAGSTFNMGAPTVNINVAGTNASAEEIAGAVKDGLTGLGDYMLNIQARQMRRATI